MIVMEAEKKRSKGRFLNLFDWSNKSKKKLFSCNEESKQENQNVQIQNLSLSQIDESSSCSTTSTVTSDDVQVSKAPNVVARLMGLESLPRSNLDFDLDPFFIRSSSSHKGTTWNDAYENLGYVNLRTDYNGVPWDHLDTNRFKTETLPPRSAKPISVTHNKLLSPIRSPGFVQSKNPAYVMEAASRMIEPSPRKATKARCSSSSSVPMRIKDLKEKLEASQKRPISNGNRNSKRTTSPSKSSFDGLKAKVKPSSVSTGAKADTTRRLKTSTPSNCNRSQKEKIETKNLPVKKALKESATSTGKSVIKSNNQKQNQLVSTSVSNQKGNKVMNKVVNKVLVESRTTKRSGFRETSSKNETTSSLSSKKTLPRSKKPLNGVQETDKRIKRGEKLIKCNINVDSEVKTSEDMNVISFTFSSPIKGISSSIKKTDQDTKSAFSFNNIDGDSLNLLLEQKLRELTSKIESSSCSSLITQEEEEETSSSISKDWVNGTLSLPSDENESVSDFYNNRNFQREEQEVNSFSTVTETENLQISDQHNESEQGYDFELEYITEIIASNQLMIKEVSLGMSSEILPLSLFDEIESHQRDEHRKIERRTLFDFVNQWLTFECEKGRLLSKEEILVEEMKKEIERLKKMREMIMMDDVVDNDMSNGEGKWVDYKKESFEESVEIEEEIVSDLVDELVNDLLLL